MGKFEVCSSKNGGKSFIEEHNIEHRVGAAARVIGAMRKEVLERRELKKATKMRVYNAMVIPTMLYGSET